MARNLVICCDGTGNQFGSVNTSVVRIVQTIERDPAKQRLYYDPGVGTMPEPGVWGKVQQKYSQIMGLAVGAGLMGKVQEAYTYLMNIWEPGDRIFLFGFSRGAYTVRVLAGMLHTLGLLPRGNENLVPYVAKNYQALTKKNFHDWEKLCNDFRWTFARPITENDERRCPVHFLGVWDTVSSVGWLWDPPTYPFTTNNPSISVIRHAVSVDERRCFFRQNLMKQSKNQDFKQYWFSGVHSDVGGGYPEVDSSLWREPFEWMLKEAEDSGLELKSHRLASVRSKTPSVSQHPWTDPQHESLRGSWWILEFFPKPVWRPDLKRKLPQLGLGRHRSIPENALIHKSVLLRIQDKDDYAPPNLSNAFREKVRNLSEVPVTMGYE
ncbi:MAG: hypothetical protein CXR31_11735 [Geobacter sp.]|nr:MAG: hypothetical protein CXR31_11735 [Geobacter sp.]